MARNPRPVNPADGPLQAFAVELRRLRAQAGDPTYRSMATTAGFSATTLSEAAGGVRRPSLDVTLAFVGVCGGDAEQWRRRWLELDRALAAEADAPGRAEPAGDGDDAVSGNAVSGNAVLEGAGLEGAVLENAASETVAWPRAAARRWRWALAAAAVVAVGLVLAVLLPSTPSPAPAAATADAACPAAGGRPVAFTGTTYSSGANIRAGASLDASVSFHAPAGCTLAFSGYCLGDVLKDLTAGTPDMRWFELSGGGVVASAIIHGDPPAALSPTRCPDDADPPTAITLTVGRDAGGTGTVDLLATGPGVQIVGYAAYYVAHPGGSGAAGTARWHQIGFADEATVPAAGLPWRLGEAGATAGGSGVPVVAVACLGGGGPTGVTASRTVTAAGPAASSGSPALPAPDLSAAERAACQYPKSG